MKHKTALAAQVAAWNRANAEANKISVQLAEIFKPMVGKKVTCNGGSLTAKCKAILHPFPCEPALHIWHACSDYSLQFLVRTCEIEDKETYEGSHYAETYVSIGNLNNHILESVNDPCTDRRTDYTEAEIIAKREAVNTSEEAFHKAESDLSPFKRYDW